MGLTVNVTCLFHSRSYELNTMQMVPVVGVSSEQEDIMPTTTIASVDNKMIESFFISS